MKKITKLLILSLLGISAVLLLGTFTSGCSESDKKYPLTNVQFEITDAPFAFDAISQANIVVEGIAVVASGGITSVSSQTMVYDLVGLQHGTTAIMGNFFLPGGEYSEVRLTVSEATVTLTDGRSFPLKIPSGSSSGLKVKLDPPLLITSGVSQRLVFDFDLSRSFVAQPNSAKKAEDIRGFIFKPVVRAAVAESSGELAGQVLSAVDNSPIAGATLTLSNIGGDFSQTAASRSDGTFVFAFLPADLYIVEVETLEGLAATSEVVQVTVGNRVEVTLTP